MRRMLVAALLLWLTGLAAEARQVALVVGIARYDRVEALKNPSRDAAAVADRLRDQGFEVIEAFDADRFQLDRARRRFLAEARQADLALFYFAGHGIQLFDRNVLLVRDADPALAQSIAELGLDLTQFMADLRAAGPVRSAILIDACRDNPLPFDETVALLRRLEPVVAATPGARSVAGARAPSTRGLSVVELPPRVGGAAELLTFFAAQPGQVSFDGDGRHSYFVEGLLEAFGKGDRPFSELLRSAGAYVRTVTKGQQVPQLVSDWTGDLVLGQASAAKVRYLNTSRAKGDGGLSEAEARIVGEAARAYPAFNGTFIVRESHAFTDAHLEADEATRARVKAIGGVNGFAIDYDIDRDGRDETIAAYFVQVNVVLNVIDEGVSLKDTPCFGENDQVESIELALRDINGDRRPELFLYYRSEAGGAWGNLCILEYQGSAGLADRRRAGQGTDWAQNSLFRTLLRHEGAWTISVGQDNSIETCAGSNCHTRSAYSFDGAQFRMTLDESEAPKGGKIKPFRDHAEREQHLKVDEPAASSPAAQRAPVQPAPARPEAMAPSGAVGPQIQAAISRYVAEVYLPSGVEGAPSRLSYEPQVAYYGKPTTRSAVLADKQRYAAKWPSRSYRLVPDSVRIEPVASGGYVVAFEYAFEVANGPRRIDGRGRTRLQVRSSGSGFVIGREEGEVVERR